jgi:hypothetical protein
MKTGFDHCVSTCVLLGCLGLAASAAAQTVKSAAASGRAALWRRELARSAAVAGVPPTSPAPVGSAASRAVFDAGGSDECRTPELLSGSFLGVSFDTTMATTGLEGQDNARCDVQGTRAIENDVWFLWTAPFDGIAIVRTCSPFPPQLDTRVAVYEGAECPTQEPVECSDDDGCGSSHALGSWVSFQARAGSDYLIQVGHYPGSATGQGGLSLELEPVLDPSYVYDSFGGPWMGFGLTSDGEIAWLHRFDAFGGSDTLDALLVAFGSTSGVGPPLVNGTPATVGVWSDPDQDGDPSDAELLASVATTVENAHTGIKNPFELSPPVHVEGKFFVGAMTSCIGGQTPAPVNGSGVKGWSHSGRAWLVGSTNGPLDLGCLDCNDLPPVTLASLFVAEGQFELAARSGGTGLAYCFGDGSGTPCPCGNIGSPGAGCAHSQGEGALLWCTGTPRVHADDLVLTTVQLPTTGGVGLYIVGSQQSAAGLGVPFMDGLRCVGGQIFRYPAKPISPFNHLEQREVVSAAGNLIHPGATWNFQSWYRNPPGPCGTGANLSNALSVTFTP